MQTPVTGEPEMEPECLKAVNELEVELAMLCYQAHETNLQLNPQETNPIDATPTDLYT